LGNNYVYNEFSRHAKIARSDDALFSKFISEWKAYKNTMEAQSKENQYGAPLDKDAIVHLSNDQTAKLNELKKAAFGQD
jgi:hypothetical protein